MLQPIRHLRPVLILLGWLLLFMVGGIYTAQATHIRAGEIIVLPDSSKNDPRCVVFKLITYTDFKLTAADNPDATLHFGDGESQLSQRRHKTIARAEDTFRSVYYFYHCFPATGTYTVTYTEQNRAIGVVNINDSQNQSFLLQTTLTIDPFIGANRSPVLTVAPLDFAACGQPFVHNPGAFDADGDRLLYRLVTPKRNSTVGTAERPVVSDVIGYRELDDPSFQCQSFPNPPGGPSTLEIDRNTGQITWNSPCLAGDYNVAFIVEEYRGGRKIGEVMRDMQVRVVCIPNVRPTLVVPSDTCVVAGTTVTGRVRAIDPDNTRLTLEAYSEVLPTARFTVSGNNGTFTWDTKCTDVILDTVQVTFKVNKTIPNPPGAPYVLSDIQPWLIRVVAPAPRNLKVTRAGDNLALTWDPYLCQNADRIVIYRREGPSSFVPGPCETGIPESAGYTKVGEVAKDQTTFTDTGGTEKLKRSVSYCYVIYAEFAGANFRTLASIATLPVCTEAENVVPVITHVTVEKTDVSDGQILVKWTQPTEGLEDLAAPLQYRLLRAPGAAPTNFTEVFRTSNLAVTSFLDSPLSTTAGAGTVKWVYKLEFYQGAGQAGEALVDTAPTASSVQLKAEAGASAITLNWTYQVPWDNSQRKHYVYRRQVNQAFVLIDSVDAGATSGQYVDRGTFGNSPLIPNQMYCYQVRTNGTYGNPQLPDPLLNFSQEFCVALKDSVAPCPPVLSIDQLNCEAFLANPTSPPYQNVLSWVPDQSPTCDQEIAYFTIYYRPQEEGDFDSIAVTNAGTTTFTHANLPSYAGCYVVTATDLAGNESAPSNTVCKDNCFFFSLPNIITPNNDGKNDVFQPDPRSRFIKSVKFSVFNRWGEKVFEGDQDPNINWGGVNKSGKDLAPGIYYYLAEVEFLTLSPAKARQTFKGWVEIVR